MGDGVSSPFKIGDIIAVHGTSWKDKEVEELTHSPYSHVAIYTGGGFCYEENGIWAVGGVPVKYYQTPGNVLLRLKRELDPNGDSLSKVMDYLVDHRHEAYDWLEIFDLFLHYQFGKPLTHHDPNKSICSSILARSFKEEGGLEIIPGKDPDTVIPGDYPISPIFDTIQVFQ